MASLYTRKGSPFYWLKYRDTAGELHQVSTGCRWDIAPDVRRAKAIAAEKTLIELNSTSRSIADLERWDAWVPTFIDVTYGGLNTTTPERYRCSWQTLRMFLDEYKILSPRQLTRQHCLDFIAWRQRPKAKGRYKAGVNTALLDLKVLRIIMNEALERNFIAVNPCLGLGIKRAKTKLKPEYTDEQLALVERAIDLVPDPKRKAFLRHSFLISRYQGCRLAETRLDPMTAVAIQVGPDGQKHGTITFCIKGDKEHQTMLHPKLIPLFEDLQSKGCTSTWENPTSLRQWPSITWRRFLRGLKLPTGACFHSLRVTVITRLARNKVPENLAKNFVGHASTLVHRTYQRLGPNDLASCATAVE